MSEEKIFQLELSLLSTEIRKSYEALDALLSDDFFEIGASGKVYNKQAVLAALPLESDRAFLEISNFAVHRLAEDLILATYILKEEARLTHRSSIWKNKSGLYQMIFHQGTIIREPARESLISPEAVSLTDKPSLK